MIHGTLAFLSIMGVLPSSPWLHFQNEGVSLEWVNALTLGLWSIIVGISIYVHKQYNCIQIFYLQVGPRWVLKCHVSS